MDTLDGTTSRHGWRAAYPTPATEQQLKTLCELYGMTVRLTPRLDGSCEPAWRITTLCGQHVCRFWISSPIERYIARIAEWRQRQS